MAETVTSLFGGHRPPADRPPASWPTVQPAACLQSFGYATLTSSAPSSSTGPPRRDTDDSLTSYLRRCRHSYRLRYRRSRPFNPSFSRAPAARRNPSLCWSTPPRPDRRQRTASDNTVHANDHPPAARGEPPETRRQDKHRSLPLQ